MNEFLNLNANGEIVHNKQGIFFSKRAIHPRKFSVHIFVVVVFKHNIIEVN